jgi:hypothetical protein
MLAKRVDFPMLVHHLYLSSGLLNGEVEQVVDGVDHCYCLHTRHHSTSYYNVHLDVAQRHHLAVVLPMICNDIGGYVLV